MESEEVAMRAGAGQFENEDVFVDLVDEKPVWRDVALAVVSPVADERMVAALWRKLLSVGKLSDDSVDLGFVLPALNCPLVVFFEPAGPVDKILFVHRANSAKASSTVYRGRFGSRAMRSPSSIAAMVSALGMFVPSMMKGMRFSRTTVLMYTVMTDEAESPMSSQKWVKRSFVALSSDIVMLAMSDSPRLMWETGELYYKAA